MVCGVTYDSNMLKLEHINVEAMRILTEGTRISNIAKLYAETQLQTISERRDISMLQIVYKIKNDLDSKISVYYPPEAKLSIYKLQLKTE